MIRRAQYIAVEKYGSSAKKTLEEMWIQRMHWWFAHLGGRPDAEASAAAKAAMLHARLLDRTDLPDALIASWEREWDDWFEKKLYFVERAS